MKYILGANTFLCIITGVILVIYPPILIDFQAKNPVAVEIARSWGFSVSVMAFLTLFMNRLIQNETFIQAGLFLLVIFHGSMLLSTGIGSYHKLFPVFWPFIHLLFLMYFGNQVYKIFQSRN